MDQGRTKNLGLGSVVLADGVARGGCPRRDSRSSFWMIVTNERPCRLLKNLGLNGTGRRDGACQAVLVVASPRDGSRGCRLLGTSGQASGFRNVPQCPFPTSLFVLDASPAKTLRVDVDAFLSKDGRLFGLSLGDCLTQLLIHGIGTSLALAMSPPLGDLGDFVGWQSSGRRGRLRGIR